MRKNKTPIFKNMELLGSMWKLRFFFSLLLLFLFSNLSATENPSTENAVRIEVDSLADKNAIHENNNQLEIYVSNGTIIYGIENISIKADSGTHQKNKTPQKQISQKVNDRTATKKIITRKETKTKVSQDQAIIHLSSHESDHSFVSTNHLFATGITTSNPVKEVIISSLLYADLFNLVNTNSLYSNFSFFKGGCCAEFSLFTRPPPSY